MEQTTINYAEELGPDFDPEQWLYPWDLEDAVLYKKSYKQVYEEDPPLYLVEIHAPTVMNEADRIVTALKVWAAQWAMLDRKKIFYWMDRYIAKMFTGTCTDAYKLGMSDQVIWMICDSKRIPYVYMVEYMDCEEKGLAAIFINPMITQNPKLWNGKNSSPIYQIIIRYAYLITKYWWDSGRYIGTHFWMNLPVIHQKDISLNFNDMLKFRTLGYATSVHLILPQEIAICKEATDYIQNNEPEIPITVETLRARDFFTISKEALLLMSECSTYFNVLAQHLEDKVATGVYSSLAKLTANLSPDTPEAAIASRRKSLCYLLSDRSIHIHLIKSNGVPIGQMFIETGANKPVYLRNIYLKKEYRGKKIGRFLMNSFLSEYYGVPGTLTYYELSVYRQHWDSHLKFYGDFDFEPYVVEVGISAYKDPHTATN